MSHRRIRGSFVTEQYGRVVALTGTSVRVSPNYENERRDRGLRDDIATAGDT